MKVSSTYSTILVEPVLGKLSLAYQEVFTLHHESDLTFAEISAQLGKSINTVKSQYRRALLALQKLLT
ncbi:MAG: hypothetical protein A3J04_01930 [Candidatus Ryanbacteria bacterium RIFCSPLOWO2_02_FULL_47_14]|uniref:RNA polymerase sigma factor 70 region 4 type 2 domain-containing protein n=1 Tax=Candidatus Ryanbacteria bacterium RIFCSPLOWO2_02_FULL_47_14 TaxID=1802129 RepID=A0A1G2H3N2_9BACT|nr:MAG: hypothetical protein A3J04_01930 [Candidatus Ryanbacteria bacterium RIFCSPLOWO2_02_FULL_47_14]